jgi:cysteine sulfinate desulfinase/cysteine desulfurase-like protein
VYAPKGIGALYVHAGVRLEPLVYGGGQERGLRAGTESVALAVALGAAAHLACTELDTGAADRIRILRDLLHHRLAELLPGRVQLNGHRARRLPNTINISITGVRGDDLLAATPGITASTGSACHTGMPEPSPVLLAMGHDHGTVRVAPHPRPLNHPRRHRAGSTSNCRRDPGRPLDRDAMTVAVVVKASCPLGATALLSRCP